MLISVDSSEHTTEQRITLDFPLLHFKTYHLEECCIQLPLLPSPSTFFLFPTLDPPS